MPGLCLGFGLWPLALIGLTPLWQAFEDAQPRGLRRVALLGFTFGFVAYDSWFGDSHEPWIHLAMAKFRAVEHRRFVVRATNSGISAVVDPVGRELVRSGVLTRENLRATVGRLDGTTVYTDWGDWVGWLAAAIVLVATVWRNGPWRAAERPACQAESSFPRKRQSSLSEPFVTPAFAGVTKEEVSP